MLFQFPEHFDKYVLRHQIKLSKSIHPVTCALSSFSKPMGNVADCLLRVDWRARDRHPTAGRGNRGSLAIWTTADSDNPLGDGISQVPR